MRQWLFMFELLARILYPVEDERTRRLGARRVALARQPEFGQNGSRRPPTASIVRSPLAKSNDSRLFCVFKPPGTASRESTRTPEDAHRGLYFTRSRPCEPDC